MKRYRPGELGISADRLALDRSRLSQEGSQFQSTFGQHASEFNTTQAAAERQRQLDEQYRRDKLAQDAAAARTTALTSLVSPQPWWTAANQDIVASLTSPTFQSAGIYNPPVVQPTIRDTNWAGGGW